MVKEKKPVKRLSRQEYFIKIAKLVSLRSTCPRLQVGAILVYKNRLVSTGYNGSPPGSSHCLDVGCDIENKHCQNTLHAELNAILFLKERLKPLTLYTTHFPCHHCLKALITIGITKIYYLEEYNDPRSLKLIYDSEIRIEKVKNDENISI